LGLGRIGGHLVVFHNFYSPIWIFWPLLIFIPERPPTKLGGLKKARICDQEGAFGGIGEVLIGGKRHQVLELIFWPKFGRKDFGVILTHY